jgi:hypothetical protein
LSHPDLALTGHLSGQAPVQAEGHIKGYPFYFRAKWDSWTFTVCLNGTGDPICIGPPSDEDGLFKDREHQGFYMGRHFPEAGYMRYDEAEALILSCAQLFLRQIVKCDVDKE